MKDKPVKCRECKKGNLIETYVGYGLVKVTCDKCHRTFAYGTDEYKALY